MALFQAVEQVVQSSADGALNVRTLLLFLGGAVLLAFFSSIGIIARMRENRIEERKRTGRSPSNQAEGRTSDSGGEPGDPNK
jgi:hypothetical protein